MTARRLGTFVMWTLAIVLPGGVPAVALLLSVRAARARAALSADRVSVVPAPSLPG